MKRNLKEFHNRIINLDGGVCRGCGKERATSAHHIKYRGQGGDESSENGIGFGDKCDHKAHHGYTDRTGQRVIAHRFVLDVLESHKGTEHDRWTKARDELKVLVERLEFK